MYWPINGAEVIVFKNVSKSFGATSVLKNITFQVQQNEILFILGVSGTGKSVLLKSIVGLLRPDTGEIWINDQNVSELKESEYFSIRKKCGMVFQQPALFDSFTIYENIAFGLRKHFQFKEIEIKECIHECIQLVHLENSILPKFPEELSYGMQKRVSLARTLAIQPQILLFDEPTTGLDPISMNAINSLIQKLSRKLKTISLVVSHDMGCALDIADRIMILDQGHFIEQGTPEEIKKSKNPLVKAFLSEVLEDRT